MHGGRRGGGATGLFLPNKVQDKNKQVIPSDLKITRV